MIDILGLALTLALAPPADTGGVAVRAEARAGPRRTENSWTHDAGHFLTMAVSAPSVYTWARTAGASRSTARWLTAGTMIAAVVLKEVYDYNEVENFSGRDIALGLTGAGLGLIAAERLFWPGDAQRREPRSR
jgi:hypothetical protein